MAPIALHLESIGQGTSPSSAIYNNKISWLSMILQTPELGFLVQTVPSPTSRTGWSRTFGLLQQQMRTSFLI